MAVRYSKREQTKLVNRVKKLIDQGNTLNAACTAVSEREGGSPATNTLANWVKAAGAADAAAAAPEQPKRRRRTRPTAAEAPEQTPATTEQEQATTEQEPEAAATSEPLPTAADRDPLPEPAAAPEQEQEPIPAATLVHVRTAGSAADTALEFDDLLDENHRLRTALTEANREIRAMRDLLVVYASR
ncbi:hypothetical protein [Nocardia sp. NPDC024068]|uniref:hypothetical protein n=1 Tax=Nocardia sp. NPDC024068 TaxID=3157197 RepID=UPI0033DD381F